MIARKKHREKKFEDLGYLPFLLATTIGIISYFFFMKLIGQIGIILGIVFLVREHFCAYCYKEELKISEYEKFMSLIKQFNLDRKDIFDAREVAFSYIIDNYPNCDINVMHNCKQIIKELFTPIGEKIETLSTKEGVEHFFKRLYIVEHALLAETDKIGT